jgi:hypothetical protein
MLSAHNQQFLKILTMLFLIPLYKVAGEKVHNLKILFKRPLTSMHFFRV